MKKMMLSLATATMLLPVAPALAAPTYERAQDRYSVDYGTSAGYDRDRRHRGHGLQGGGGGRAERDGAGASLFEKGHALSQTRAV